MRKLFFGCTTAYIHNRHLNNQLHGVEFHHSRAVLKRLKRLADRAAGIKDIDTEKGIIQGYFSAFNSKDSDDDIIVPGAFAKTIVERGPASSLPRIRHLQDHDRFKGVCNILELVEDPFGLKYTSKAGRHTAGQDYLYMCEDKIIREHSIGYGIIQSHQDPATDANMLTELKLWEGSGLQGWGANPNTPVTGIKADMFKSAEDMAEMFELLTHALRKGKYSDETFKEFILPAYEALETALKARTTEPNPKQETTQPDDETKDDAADFAELKSFLTTVYQSND